MPEPVLSRKRAEALVASDPEGAYEFVRTDKGEFLVLNHGVIEIDGERSNTTVVARIMEAGR